MTARVCHDWSSLKYSADPIPGDPDQVEAAAKSYATTADSISQVSDYLANLDAEGQRSETITALVARGRELSGQLLSAGGRYNATASALRYYAPELRAAQAIADSAAAEGVPAEAQRKQALHNAQEIRLGWMTTMDPNRAKEFEDSYRMAEHQITAAAHEVGQARHRIEEAIRRRDEAAERAKSMIESAIENSPMTDTVVDRFKEILDKTGDILGTVGEWIWDNIDTISLVLTVAATALAFIPGLQLIAPVLFALSKVATIVGRVKAVVGVVKSITSALRTGDWSGVVATGAAALASWGVGKLGGALAGKLSSGAKSLVGQAVYAFSSRGTSGAAGALSKIVMGTAQAGLVATEAATTVVGAAATKKVTKVLTELATAEVSKETKRHITDYVGEKVEDYINEKLVAPVQHVVADAVHDGVENFVDSYRLKTQTCGGAQ